MSIGVWIAVALLGGLFSVLRFLVDAAVAERLAAVFPWGTFVVNVSGSFLLGVVVGAAVTGSAFILVGSACIGSYTTFSTWMLETHRLGEDDDRRPVLAYVLASLLVGLAATAAGHRLGGLL